eukprot:5160936-Prorocentrum_lima.AAC.1
MRGEHTRDKLRAIKDGRRRPPAAKKATEGNSLKESTEGSRVPRRGGNDFFNIGVTKVSNVRENASHPRRVRGGLDSRP